VFSQHPYFNRLVDAVLGGEENHLVRESWIIIGETWIPYPFQNNLRYLPKEVQLNCLFGAAKAAFGRGAESPTNFEEWIVSTFGEGIAEAFMFPYNSKVDHSVGRVV